jgi:ubiquinone/menaquinone biosynthesis C-methylase UbiE
MAKDSTSQTKRRYDRVAPFYDLMEGMVERRRFSDWRKRLTERIRGPKALEVGVGTGKNMPYYPKGVAVTAIDLSPRMLQKAQKRADKLGVDVELKEMDAQHLGFADHCFDTVFATLVFCSVPNPVLGLSELRRVCKPDDRLLLLEHRRPENPYLALVFDALNPLVVRMMGANINRKTVDNVQRAGWMILKVDYLSGDVVRWIEAVP